MTTDAAGNLYLTGTTSATDFPHTSGMPSASVAEPISFTPADIRRLCHRDLRGGRSDPLLRYRRRYGGYLFRRPARLHRPHLDDWRRPCAGRGTERLFRRQHEHHQFTCHCGRLPYGGHWRVCREDRRQRNRPRVSDVYRQRRGVRHRPGLNSSQRPFLADGRQRRQRVSRRRHRRSEVSRNARRLSNRLRRRSRQPLRRSHE